MKRLALFSLAALLFVPAAMNAQMQNKNLGKKMGPYEIKIGKDKWTKDAPVTAIWNNETKTWVTSPVIDKKGSSLYFLPPTEVDFLEGDDYVPEAQGLVVVYWGFRWDKQIEYPTRKWSCNGECGVYKIEDDKLVPIVESGNSLDRAYAFEARYAYIRVVPKHALIIGSFLKKDKETNPACTSNWKTVPGTIWTRPTAICWTKPLHLHQMGGDGMGHAFHQGVQAEFGFDPFLITIHRSGGNAQGRGYLGVAVSARNQLKHFRFSSPPNRRIISLFGRVVPKKTPFPLAMLRMAAAISAGAESLAR